MNKKKEQSTDTEQVKNTFPPPSRPDKTWQPKTGKKKREQADIVPVVGIGDSAGGLDALSKFFKAMPSDSGIAFVVVQHLDPTHKSLMADLLAK